MHLAVVFGEAVKSGFDDARDFVPGRVGLDRPEVGSEHKRAEVHYTLAGAYARRINLLTVEGPVDTAPVPLLELLRQISTQIDIREHPRQFVGVVVSANFLQLRDHA